MAEKLQLEISFTYYGTIPIYACKNPSASALRSHFRKLFSPSIQSQIKFNAQLNIQKNLIVNSIVPPDLLTDHIPPFGREAHMFRQQNL